MSFILPNIGEGIDNISVSEILVQENQEIKANDSVLLVETDKASMEIPLETPGVIKEILVQVGDEINIGQPLFKIDEEEVESKSKKTTQKPFEKKQEVANLRNASVYLLLTNDVGRTLAPKKISSFRSNV